MDAQCPCIRMVKMDSISAILPPLPTPALKGTEIVLASASPRRRQLLGLILPHFSMAPIIEIDETYPPGLTPSEVPEHISRIKAKAYLPTLRADQMLITADTVVISDGHILGKPHSPQEAVEMLVELSGHTHYVTTGVTLYNESADFDTFSCTTAVTFAPLPLKTIEEYVDRYKPYDKAGAYGIQEWIGAVAISHIDGCFYNVMGLPLHMLYQHLSQYPINFYK